MALAKASLMTVEVARSWAEWIYLENTANKTGCEGDLSRTILGFGPEPQNEGLVSSRDQEGMVGAGLQESRGLEFWLYEV